MVRIEEAVEATSELQKALAHLLPQLNPKLPVPTMERLQAIMADPSVTLFLAKDGEEAVGTATVIVYTTPFWIKARLDEVVVDESARGKGVGAALVGACLEVARRRGAGGRGAPVWGAARGRESPLSAHGFQAAPVEPVPDRSRQSMRRNRTVPSARQARAGCDLLIASAGRLRRRACSSSRDRIYEKFLLRRARRDKECGLDGLAEPGLLATP